MMEWNNIHCSVLQNISESLVALVTKEGMLFYYCLFTISLVIHILKQSINLLIFVINFSFVIKTVFRFGTEMKCISCNCNMRTHLHTYITILLGDFGILTLRHDMVRQRSELILLLMPKIYKIFLLKNNINNIISRVIYMNCSSNIDLVELSSWSYRNIIRCYWEI